MLRILFVIVFILTTHILEIHCLAICIADREETGFPIRCPRAELRLASDLSITVISIRSFLASFSVSLSDATA